MKKEIIVIVVILLLIALPFLFVSFSSDDVTLEKCVDINRGVLDYELCHSTFNRNILMLVSRGFDNYSLNSFNISFNNGADYNYEFKNVPEQNSSVIASFVVESSPRILSIFVNVVKDFDAPICEAPHRLLVRPCSSNFLDMIDDGQDIATGGGLPGLSDNLKEKEDAWRNICESDWECLDWESCDSGFQGRRCVDKNNCEVSTDVPQIVKYCSDRCTENWECDWSSCDDGFSVPSCADKNNCGTTYALPKKIECSFEIECFPDVQCGEWSSCAIDYSLISLVDTETGEFDGVKSRVCRDSNSCLIPTEEIARCTIGVDIYTRRVERCDLEFIEVYNSLDDSLIASIQEGAGDNPYLNINLDVGDRPFCDYCYDGRKTGDEEGVDCGGSCVSCEEKYGEVDFKRSTAWSKFVDWIR